MSIYSEQLAKLKKDIEGLTARSKKKRWKANQKIMIDFINGVTKKAEFKIDDKKLILLKGDEYSGFRHILEGHYYNNDLEAIDIINIANVFIRGLRLNEVGVTNPNSAVYHSFSNEKEHKLILKEVGDNSWVITFYRKT